MTLPTDLEPLPLDLRQFIRALILVPRLIVLAVVCVVTWILSVAKILATFMLNAYLGAPRRTLISRCKDADRRVCFVHDWLTMRHNEDSTVVYPDWFMRWHRWHLKCVHFAAKAALFSLGYLRVHITGEPRESTLLFVCNHRGIIDTLVLSFVLDEVPYFVSGAGILNLPFLREVALSADCFVVEPAMKNVGVDMLRSVLLNARARANENGSKTGARRRMVLFPGGEPEIGCEITRWHHPKSFEIVAPRFMGAISLTFEGPGHFSPSWVTGLQDLFYIIFTLARIPSNRCRVRFLSPVPSPSSSESVALSADVMERYRLEIARALELPILLDDGSRIMPHLERAAR